MKAKRYKVAAIAALFLGMSVSSASATYMADITYDYVDNGGGSYTFDFTVKNTSDGTSTDGLDFFLIDFDADATWSNYSNVSWVSDNSWLSDAYEYDAGFSGLPAGVNADDSVFLGSGGGGIAKGVQLGGFRVMFDYAGSLAPEDQLFSWIVDFGTSDVDNGGIDVGGYWVAEELYGVTQYDPGNTGGNPVPEPATMLLFGTGLAGLVGLRRKKRGAIL